MSITAKSVYRDTGDFLRYQFITILLIVLSCTVITAVIGHVLSPSEEQFSSVMDADNLAETNNPFELVQSMTLEQQKNAVTHLGCGNDCRIDGVCAADRRAGCADAKGYSPAACQRVKCNGSQRADGTEALFTASAGHFYRATRHAVPLRSGHISGYFPRPCTDSAGAGKNGRLCSMRSSMRFSRANMRFVAPPVVAWLLTKFLMLRYGHHLIAFSPEGGAIIANALSNLFSAVLLIYLFRLYMLMRK